MTKMKYFNMTQLEKEPFVKSEGINLVKSRYKMCISLSYFPPVVFILIILLLIKIEKSYLWSEKMT